MENPAKTVVENMFEAFSAGDGDKFVATVSDDTVWIYHGTQIIPAGTFKKRKGYVHFLPTLWNVLKS